MVGSLCYNPDLVPESYQLKREPNFASFVLWVKKANQSPNFLLWEMWLWQNFHIGLWQSQKLWQKFSYSNILFHRQILVLGPISWF